jgi:peptidoglycan/LPS O-acetylase OafA/YrhL
MTKMGPGFFRLFLSFVVVFHHSFPLRLGAWGVYVFFILSGFWICRMWRQRYVWTHHPLLTFIISRWWRLAPVFLICTVLSVASSVFLGEAGALQRASNPLWWVRQFLIAGSKQVGTDLPPTWSLDVEMQFYLVAPFLIALFERIRPVFRWMIIAVASGWLSFYIFRGGNVQNAQLTLFVGFFLIGVTIEMGEWKPSRTTAMSSLIFFFGMTLILAVCPLTRNGIWIVGFEAAPTTGIFPMFAVNLWWILGSAAVIPFVTWNVAQNSPRLDRLLGNLAYPLYLFHWIPRDWYYHIGQRSNPIWKQGALLSINFLAASAGAVIILLVVDQPLDRLRTRWVAGRKKKREVGRRSSGVAGVQELKNQDSHLSSWCRDAIGDGSARTED